MINYKCSETDGELKQILELQAKNIPSAISDTEKNREGFVTVHHTMKILKKMHEACPHIIAVNGPVVVGYALCMTKEFAKDIPVLIPMFKQIKDIISEDTSYIVMGQVCIDKSYRRKGIFRGLYDHMKRCLKDRYDLIVTEVDEANTRSMQAHYAIGFKSLKKYRADNHDWDLIGWSIK